MAYGLRTISRLKAPSNLVPLLLHSSLESCTNISHGVGRRRSRPRRHQLHVDATTIPSHGSPTLSQLFHLPRSCPGCGAFTQTVKPEQPGFYGTNRKSVKAFIGRNRQCPAEGVDEESILFERVVGAADVSLLSQMGLHERGEGNAKGKILWVNFQA